MAAALYYRELLLELTKREIKQRYKQSVLGYVWVILMPLAQMLVMAFVFSKILRIPSLEVPYPLFLYAGILPWTLFTNSLTASAQALVGNSGLLTKIYFPRVIFVQSTLLSKMVDFFLSVTVFVLFMAFYRLPLTFHILWVIPIFLIQALFMYGLSLLIATLNLFYRDIQYLLNLILIVWMYITPVIYPADIFPKEYQWIFLINPMSVIIESYREVILFAENPDIFRLGIAGLLSFILLLIARFIFQRLEGVFADVV